MLFASAPATGALVSFGAAAGDGSQAVTAFASVDEGIGGCQRVGAAVAAPATDGSKGVSALARVAAFGGDGVTLAWSEVDGIGSVAYLALAGGGYEVGVDVMPRQTRVRTTSLAHTAPAAVLFSSWGLYGGDETRRIARVSLGAASSPHDGGSVVWGAGLARSSATSVVQIADTSPGSTDMHAEAALRGLHGRGFTLEWPLNDGRRPRQFVYVAFGTPVRPTVGNVLRRTLRRIRRSMRAVTTR